MKTPESVAVVLDQVAAYNAHDLERTVEYYADDAVVLDAYGKVLDMGHEGIRNAYGRVFAENPQVNATVSQVMHVGEWVTIHTVAPDWAMSDGSRQEMQWIEVYQVVEGKIRRLQLYR